MTGIMNEVAPGLYIGSYNAGCNLEILKAHGITHVLSIGDFTELFPAEFEYKIFDINDREHVDIMHIFEDTNKYIENALVGSGQRQPGKIFVHWALTPPELRPRSSGKPGIASRPTLASGYNSGCMNRWDIKLTRRIFRTSSI
ncbi:hypothetical protein BC936DRAFT_144886 [Jimgerdemannia flammicorona]|uniref:Uncharacterized protein n=1 Tax=Jimgerdemannia flammicorona TaxID=994334 RepID=A0A433DBG4_9FUNG|nr:hypothetical protein BC936DRAFT_144886 [Jimgerdemannia flammicorona]